MHKFWEWIHPFVITRHPNIILILVRVGKSGIMFIFNGTGLMILCSLITLTWRPSVIF